MIKCVVFDFDGTLVASNDIKRQVFFDIARTWDPAGEVAVEVIESWPSANRYEKTYRIAEGLIRRQLLPAEASLDSWAARLADEYTARCERAIACCAEMPGATQALDELSEMGLLLFINSATPLVPLQQLLRLRNWTHYFRAVYGAEVSKAGNLRSISREFGAAPLEIVHIGDQPDDQQGAAEFGCHFVTMAAGSNEPTVHEHPLLVRDLRELPALLTRSFQEAS